MSDTNAGGSGPSPPGPGPPNSGSQETNTGATSSSSSPQHTPNQIETENELRNRFSGPGTSSSQIPQPSYTGYNGNMSNYCKELQSWLQQAHLQRECAVSAYFTALNMMFGNGGLNRGGGPSGISNGPLGPNNEPLNNNWVNMNFPRQPGGINPIIRRFLVRGVRTNNNVIAIDFNMASTWRRIIAECIDFVLLLVVKLFVTVTIIDSFELIDLDNIDLEALQESGGLLDVALSLSWELLILELTHRIVVCFFEAWCLSKSGATPGKNLLNLRVLHCDQVIQLAPDQPAAMGNNGLVLPVGPGRILVSPGSFLTFPRALLRSAIKNFSLAFFFPFAFVFFHLEQSRTIYDLATRSIVVEIRQ